MYGGMPFLLMCKTSEQKIKYLDNLFKELQITVYDKSFDKMTLAKKKAAYKKMCEHFLKLVPRKHW